jgi:hypothetical protein
MAVAVLSAAVLASFKGWALRLALMLSTCSMMDVCFREDQSRARAGHAAKNLATLRRLALNLLKREKTKKRGIKGKQLNASWDHAYLLRLLGI